MIQGNTLHKMQISDLKINNLTAPLGVDTIPTFRWLNHMAGSGKKQTAYRIIVASTADGAAAGQGDVWDSGKVPGENNYDIPYAGAPLTSKTPYYWAVCVWDEADAVSPWSEVAAFETGILQGDEWAGKWIGGEAESATAPMLRKTFDIAKPITRARAYVCGLGLFEMKINGRPVDDTVLNPAHTQYDDTIHYRVFDVTELLTQGKNAVCVELGDGFYRNDVHVWNWQNAVWRDQPKLLMELTVDHADGTRQNLVTDRDWRVWMNGPTVRSNILTGDIYDARREVDGWELPDFQDEGWPAAELTKIPTGKLTFAAMEPMRRIAAFTPTVRDLGGGTFLIKNPVMTTGWAKIRLDAPAGTELTITYGETVDGDGYLKKPTDFGVDFQIDTYICKGEAGETYQPKFSYKGYEYIQVENYPGRLTAEDVTCYFIANDVAAISAFETGNRQINALHEAMHRTMQNNMQGKPTDTPVWEKNGWTGDFNVALETFNFNYDTSAFTAKFIGDLADAAGADGAVPWIAPTADWGMSNTVIWNGAFINAVYEGWRSFGLRTVVAAYYPAMRAQAEAYIRDIRENGWVWRDDQLSDWVAPAGGSYPDAATAAVGSEGSGICGTGYVYDLLSRMCEMAEELGKPEDAASYQAARAHIYDAFNRKYYNAEKGWYETAVWDGSATRTRYRQTSNLVPLAFGLCPAESRAGVVAHLVADIQSKEYHLDTGMVGTKLLLPVLSDAGYTDVAYNILTQQSYPSWGYWLTRGSNTTWEGYENTARSHNHYFLGTYDEWLYKYVAGIRDMRDGYKTVTIKPQVIADLTFAKCAVDTVRGRLQSDWRLMGDGSLTMEITLPVGTTAQIILPTGRGAGVTVNGEKLPEQAGITADGRVKLTAESGTYSFVIREDILMCK